MEAEGRPMVAQVVFDHLLTEYIAQLTTKCPDTRSGREALALKIEELGIDVGRRVTERLAKDVATVGDTMEVIKFICTKVWTFLFNKVIDQLQTDRMGLFMLHDKSFRWLQHVAADSVEGSKEAAKLYLVFPCALLKGSLAAFGITAKVKAILPKHEPFSYCTFEVTVAPK